MSLEAEINFSLNFFKTLDNKKSTIYSPASMLNSLSIIYFGAKGKTAEELLKIVGKDQSKAEIIDYYSRFIKHHIFKNDDEITYSPPTKKLRKDDSDEPEKSEADQDAYDRRAESGDEDNNGSDFSLEEDTTPSSKVIVANRLFVNEKIELKKSFENLIRDNFDDQIQKINFEDKNNATEVINNFVNKATNGMFEEIIHSDDISSQTSILLINAIYFVGKWENTFNFRFREKFYSNEIRKMEFMKVGPLTELYFNEAATWEAIGIPYRERKCWMFIILPKNENTLEDLIKTMDYSLFIEATKGTKSGRIEVTMPLFEISESYNLIDHLPKVGINHLFDNCDLSEMLTGPHKIDNAIHKAIIKVDEYGTIASAVTTCTAVAMGGPRLRKFTADHPFLFFIVSMEDKIPVEILFAGTFC